jgi:hypothetical protein
MTDRPKIDAPAMPALAAAWRWWLPPALLTLSLALIFIDPFAGDWDALDYTVLAVKGRPSSMLFGRLLFIFTNHALWRAAHALCGLQPEHAYLLFKYAVVAQSPLATIACWALARELTRDVRAATLGALLVALSPFYVLYSGQAMTEIPSLMWLGAGLTVHLRGLLQQRIRLVLAGAALLGLSMNIREGAMFYGTWLVLGPFICGWQTGRRAVTIVLLSGIIFLVCALGGWAYWFLMNVGGYRHEWYGWLYSLQVESARHPVSFWNLGPLMLYFFIAAPLVLVALPVAAYREWAERGLSPALGLAAAGFLANIMMVFQYSVTVNGRYLLTGLPALAPLAARYFMGAETRRTGSKDRAFVVAALSITLVMVMIGGMLYAVVRPTIESHSDTKEYRERLALLPRDAVVMAGKETVAVTFWRGMGLGEWEAIGTGAGWPGDKLVDVIEHHLRQGRRVFLDADPRWWSTHGWQLEETRAMINLESRFRFRRVSETIYEIRPPDDRTALDAPDLSAKFNVKDSK